MPRPKTKEELVYLSKENYQKLIDFIDSFPDQKKQAEFPPGTLNRNIRDVLAHLYHWHLMFQEWYRVGMSGDKPLIPAPGYTWKTVPELNRKILEIYNNVGLEEVRNLFEESHEKICQLIHKHSNEELFEKKRYKWTGTTSLGAYLVGATSSHYDWAYKLIKKVFK